MPLEDQGAILRSGMALVPDYASQEANRQLMALKRRELDFQTQQAQRQLDQRNAFEGDLAGVLANPTAEGYSRIIAKHPEFAKQAQDSWTVLDKGRQQSDLTQMGSIYAAAANGRYDIAAKTLKQRIDADKAADGTADPADEAMLAALDSGDETQRKQVVGMMGLHLSAITGPEKFEQTYGALTKDKEGYTLAPGGRRFDENNQLVAEAPFAPRVITVEDGKQYVEYTPGQTTGGAPASGGGGGGTPRGIRNNNPGNIRDGDFAKSQPGYKGADADGFAIFEKSGQGLQAQTSLLRDNYISKGFNTPDKIVERYAPASENSPESRANYKRAIASKLGIGVNDPIPPEKAGQLATAMAAFENGSGGAGGGPKVIAQGAPKAEKVANPTETRVVKGQTYVKVNGSWFRKTA